MSAAGGLPSFLPSFLPGTVWLAGAGPGDPGLLTLHAAHGLAEAEVVLHDALVAPEILALAGPRARLVPVGKRARGGGTAQLHINQRLIALARAGQRVLRLKGGDPLLFGRGSEEALALAAAGICFRLIPGISAGLGGTAAAGLPLTHRGLVRSVAFATGHAAGAGEPDWAALARGAEALVLYMALARIGDIAAALIAAGRPAGEPLVFLAAASTPRQVVRMATLSTAAAVAATLPPGEATLIVIGPAAALVPQLRAWLLPLVAPAPAPAAATA